MSYYDLVLILLEKKIIQLKFCAVEIIQENLHVTNQLSFVISLFHQKIVLRHLFH